MTAQRVLIRRHLAAQLARNGRLRVPFHVLAQAALVGQPIGAYAALDFRSRFAAMHAPIVHRQLGLAFERGGAGVTYVGGNVYAMDVRGHLPFGEETENTNTHTNV